MGTIVFPHILTDDGIVTTTQTGWEFQMHGSIVHLINFYRNYLFELFDLLLHLHCLGRFVTEALDKVLHVCHFLLLVLIGTQLLFTAFLAKHDILIVFHLVVDDTSARNFQCTVRYVIDECTVVADQYHCLGTLRQELFQPLYRLDIQMVRRLVEQQHVRLLQENLCQFDTHTPTTRELTRGAFEVRTQETKSHQRTFNLCLIVLRTHHHVTVVLLREAFHQCEIVFALIVGTLRQLLVHSVDVFLHLTDMSKRLLRLFSHGRIILQYHHLR